MRLSNFAIEGFKPFKTKEIIDLGNLNLLFGSNSCGKSSTLQALLMLKQTYESSRGTFDLLLNGKYVSLGSSTNIINKEFQDSSKYNFSIGCTIGNSVNNEEINELETNTYLEWKFGKSDTKIHNLQLSELKIRKSKMNISFENDLKIGKFTRKFNDSNNHLIDNQFININKLKIEDLQTEYIPAINRLVYSLLESIIKLLETHSEDKKNKKKVKWDKSLPYIQNSNRFFRYFENYFAKSRHSDDEILINHFTVVENISSLLGKLCEHIHPLDPMTSIVIDIFITRSLNNILVQNADIENELKQIYDEHKGLLSKILINSNRYKKEYVKLLRSRKDYRTTTDCNEIIWNASENLNEFFSHIQYLGPIREKPKGIYEYSADENSLYVGKSGQYLPGVLAFCKDDFIVDPVLPDSQNLPRIKFITALNKWAKHLGLAEELIPRIKDSLSIEVKNNSITSNLNNVGVGVSQVLPVLTMGLLSNPGDILIFEQPELHLHPYMQSKLMDFFIELSNNDRQLIIESHSEYFIKRLRLKNLQGKIDNKDLRILFFENTKENGTRVSNADIDINGDIIYPLNFKDTTEDQLAEIFSIQMEKLLNGNK